jgi:hypothetical protein
LGLVAYGSHVLHVSINEARSTLSFTATSPLHRLSDHPFCLVVGKTILATAHHVQHA